jgi:pimeloyl-ACP methyl ester carboxylesterase
MMMNKKLMGGVILAAGLIAPLARAQPVKPTVVLVHGAFADNSSWNGVIAVLEHDGYRVIAAPDTLRGVRADADVVADVVKRDRPRRAGRPFLWRFGHQRSRRGRRQCKGAGLCRRLCPRSGRDGHRPDRTIPRQHAWPDAGTAGALSGGGSDLYIRQDRFPAQFAADVPLAAARLMAATQRPIAQAALSEAETTPAWKHTPSWFIYGDADRNIPPPPWPLWPDAPRPGRPWS